MLANGWQESRGGVAPIRPRQRLDVGSSEGRLGRSGREPFGGFVDHLQRDQIAFLGGWAPGEQSVAPEHPALHVWIGLGDRAELESKIKARTLPRQEANLAAIDLLRKRLS